MRRLACGCGAAVALALAAGPASAAEGIVRAHASLPPGPYLFGEQVSAELDFLVDTKLVDAGTVNAEASFAPYEPVTAPKRSETVEGTTTRVRYGYLITCDSLGCTTGPKTERTIRFDPALVRYRDRRGEERTAKVRWPRIRLVSRSGNPQSRPETASEARRDIPIDVLLRLPASVTAPSPTYRLSPILFAAVLFVAALAALLGAAALARPVLAELRGPETAAARQLSPLEQAVARVETAAHRHPGTPEHREALAFLARELRRARMNDLVQRARRLAWSEQAPTAEESRTLAADARARHGDAA